MTSDLQFSVQTQPAKKFEIWNTYLQLNLHGDVLSKKWDCSDSNKSEDILEWRSRGRSRVRSIGEEARCPNGPKWPLKGPQHTQLAPRPITMAKKKKKNSFLLMLKQHRETKLLNHTSYNIVCTLLCIEHFLLPIKKQQPRVWKNDDIRRRFCLRQGELQLTILPEGPNTKSPWPDIERENQLTTTLQWSHLTTTTTQNHPQNILPMVQLTQRWKWRFFSQFLCVLSRCFLLLMIQKVSQSYPNARGVKKGLISIERCFSGGDFWRKRRGQWINPRSGDGVYQHFFLQNVWPPQQCNSQTGSPPLDPPS